MRVCVLLATAACASAPAPKPASIVRPPSVRITGASCLPAAQVEARISDVFRDHRAERSGLVCEVTEQAGESAQVTLRVVRPNGDVGLDRSYTLGPTDCASAPQLLALTVDRWLTSFPEWAEPEPVAAPPSRWTELAILAAVSGIAPPLGVDGAVGVLVDRGGERQRFGGTLLVRGTVPQTFGSGSFQQTALLAGASYRRRIGPWTLRGELRGGALLVTGIGLSDGSSDILPWWEVAVFAGRDVGLAVLGLEIAATGLRARAVTSDGLVSEDIPLLRVGVGATFSIR